MSGGTALAWPPLREDLERLYLEEGLSASKVAKVYRLRYANEKTTESTILYHLKRNGIARRDPAAHVRKVTEAMDEAWAERYARGESLKQIAGGAVSPVTVLHHLRSRGVKLRDKVEAQIKAVQKFEKSPFDGSDADRAYLLGFVRGDLGVARHGRAIRVKTSSTHPAMIDLVLSLFKPYGPVRLYPRFNQLVGYEYTIEAELDQTFEFLLSQKKSAPEQRAKSKVTLSYLAGLFDAEGSVWLRINRPFAPRLSIANTDASMLDWVESSLTRLKVDCNLVGPDKNRLIQAQVWRAHDVLRLLRTMPIRHPEKKAKSRLVLRYERAPSRLRRVWNALQSEIEFDRLQLIDLARKELSK